MTCVHLKELFQICEKNEIKMSSAEVIHLVCPQCGLQETCPSALMSEIDAEGPQSSSGDPKPSATTTKDK